MPKGQQPTDLKLYEEAKRQVYAQYKKPSAYRSMALVKKYKQLGGTYEPVRKEQTINDFPLLRWQHELWADINPQKTKTSYPVFRPTLRVSEKTPKTKAEIDPKRLAEQAKRKQTIKGKKNLEKF